MIPAAKEKGSQPEEPALQPKPILFQWPTRLADGLGLKETAPSFLKGLHPKLWFPRSPSREGD